MKIQKIIPLLLSLALLAGCTHIGVQIQVVSPSETPTKATVNQPTVASETAPVSPSPTEAPTTALVPVSFAGASAILFSSNRGGDYQDLYLQQFGTNDVTRLTQGDSSTFAGPFSPDGKKIVFTGFGLTNSYVGVMNADGSGPVNLTNLDNVDDGFPAWSPDGSQIAFTSRRDGNNEIYLMDAYGYNLKRLTNNTVDDFAPAWSPDGKQIAFLSDRDNKTGVYSIYIMNTAASWVRRLTNDGGNDYTPAWSPDGNTLIFRSVQKGQSDIYSISVDGTNLTNLTNTPNAEEWSPQWSPDGTMIAFQTNRDGNWEIYTMLANGSDPVNITNNPADDQLPYWQPAAVGISQTASSSLAFVSFKDDDLALYTTSADGSRTNRLTHEKMLLMNPAWSPDGNRIAFEACPGGSMSTDCPAGISFDIYVVNADGTGLTNLTHDPLNDRYPAWTPDGRLTFSSDRTGQDEIYIMNADGSSLKQLTNGITRNTEPTWSADGKWLAYHCMRNSDTKICIQSADGSQVVQIDGTTPVWSPVSSATVQRLAYLCFFGGHSDICTVQADGSGLVNLTNTPADEISPSWSPDGRWIAYQSNEGSEIAIYMVCADCASNPMMGKLTDGKSNANWPAWSPDGTRVAYLQDGDLYVMKTDGSSQINLAGSVLGKAVWQPIK